ncbi:unnamed protein product [Soboliphyme baturini]|uniref:Mab-21 domain-containing protein n=1 Tax=Soboliphyme baturini TaxID=241478 RepID=A0A183IBY6_9BILA|nr:unnamed protein product [Soboliphyme baturini]
MKLMETADFSGQLVQISLESIRHLEGDDGNIFTDLMIGYILNQPFTVFSDTRLTEPMMLYRGKMVPFIPSDVEPESVPSALQTTCATELNRVMSSSAEGWMRSVDKDSENPYRPYLCENISDSCLKYTFEPRKLFLVHLANRAFLTSLLELVHCDKILDKTKTYAKFLPEFQVELCTNLLSLLEQLASSKFERSKFMKVLMMKIRVCDRDVTFAAAAALTTYLRFLVNPGKKSAGFWGILADKDECFSVPLEGRFWKPPSPINLPDEAISTTTLVGMDVLVMDMDHVRLHSVSDVTLYWFLTALIIFIIVTLKFRVRHNRSKLSPVVDAKKRLV